VLDPAQEHNVFAENVPVARELHRKYLDLLRSIGCRGEQIGNRLRLGPGF